MTLPREDVRRAAGRAVMCGFEGTSVGPELKEILREVRPAGVVLFARNVESPLQVSELGAEIKSLRADDPILLAVDQEGGRVARIREPATEWPAMRTLGAIDDADLARRVGAALGAELRAMNFDVDFAPVLDVDTNPHNSVIGDRSFARESDRVATLGCAFMEGLHNAGVAACGKHFPGHGDTDVDSHKALPRITHDLSRLREIEWPPFRRAIEAGLGAVMTAHVVVEALDEERPATLSRAALSPLRHELGFRGVIISDDLEMRAVADGYTVDQMVRYGLQAGVDVFLACHDPEVILGVYRAVVQSAERRDLDHDDLRALEKRVLTWSRRFYAPAVDVKRVADVVGCSEHAVIAEDVRSRASALV
ncbi:MAG: beta-N-acetylhexosaminidase [Myxococcota bacterium]